MLSLFNVAPKQKTKNKKTPETLTKSSPNLAINPFARFHSLLYN